jgi:glutamate racemase
MTIGIADWGIGGLGFYKGLKQARPDIEVVYVADQGFEMYDFLTREHLIERVDRLNRTFRGLGIQRVVMACDAAGTVLDEIDTAGMKVTGVIEPALRAMQTKRFREVGVIGGRRTILSGAYGRALRKLHFMVVQRMSLELGTAIEQGRERSPGTTQLVRELLEPICKADCILLASTEYTLIKRSILSILPDAEIMEPAVSALTEFLAELPPSAGGSKRDTFYTTGDPKELVRRANEAFDITLEAMPISVGGGSRAVAL